MGIQKVNIFKSMLLRFEFFSVGWAHFRDMILPLTVQAAHLVVKASINSSLYSWTFNGFPVSTNLRALFQLDISSFHHADAVI